MVNHSDQNPQFIFLKQEVLTCIVNEIIYLETQIEQRILYCFRYNGDENVRNRFLSAQLF